MVRHVEVRLTAIYDAVAMLSQVKIRGALHPSGEHRVPVQDVGASWPPPQCEAGAFYAGCTLVSGCFRPEAGRSE